MKWYTGTIQSPHNGTHVIHAASVKELKKMAKDLVRTDNADMISFRYDQEEINCKQDLIQWLNAFYKLDNG